MSVCREIFVNKTITFIILTLITIILINILFYNFSLFTDGDVLCFIDFRADRMRQINEAFGIKPPFETDVIPKDLVSIHRDIHVHVPLTETNIGMPRLHSTDCKSSLMVA